MLLNFAHCCDLPTSKIKFLESFEFESGLKVNPFRPIYDKKFVCQHSAFYQNPEILKSSNMILKY